MLCAALGVSRSAGPAEVWLPKLSGLNMGVRIDGPGVRWWDYHTVGAGMDMRIAEGEGKTKPGAMLTRREYLCDASFLVALQGEPRLIDELDGALRTPSGRFTSEENPVHHPGRCWSIQPAFSPICFRPRHRRRGVRGFKDDQAPQTVECLIDWEPTPAQPQAPDDALVWYDVPLTFEPPAHRPRFVIRRPLRVGATARLASSEKPARMPTPRPPRPRANYGNTEYRKRRPDRLRPTMASASSASRPPRPFNTSRTAGPAETSPRTICDRSAGFVTTQ